ncbi:MAG: hypothetical protein NVS3B25_35270 [Hymenobacter sp.]
MASPFPKPTALKKLEGTYRADRSARNEMMPTQLTTLPTAPAALNAKGAQLWYIVAGELQQLRILHTVDLELLAAYCTQIQTMHEAEFYLQKHGKVLKSKNKAGSEYYQKNPWLGIYNDALAMANRLGQQFGFTPSARSRISTPPPEEDGKDPFAEMMNDMKG